MKIDSNFYGWYTIVKKACIYRKMRKECIITEDAHLHRAIQTRQVKNSVGLPLPQNSLH